MDGFVEKESTKIAIQTTSSTRNNNNRRGTEQFKATLLSISSALTQKLSQAM
jgi:hypothetical protein